MSLNIYTVATLIMPPSMTRVHAQIATALYGRVTKSNSFHGLVPRGISSRHIFFIEVQYTRLAREEEESDGGGGEPPEEILFCRKKKVNGGGEAIDICYGEYVIGECDKKRGAEK